MVWANQNKYGLQPVSIGPKRTSLHRLSMAAVRLVATSDARQVTCENATKIGAKRTAKSRVRRAMSGITLKVEASQSVYRMELTTTGLPSHELEAWKSGGAFHLRT